MNRREVEAFAEAVVVDPRVKDAHALLVKALRAFTFQEYGEARGYTSMAYRQLDEIMAEQPSILGDGK